MIKLTVLSDSYPVWLNVNHVMRVYKHGKDHTAIHMSDDTHVCVQETPDTVVAMLRTKLR